MRNKKLQHCVVIILLMPGSIFSMAYWDRVKKVAKNFSTNLAHEVHQLLADDDSYAPRNLDDPNDEQDVQEQNNHFIVSIPPSALIPVSQEPLSDLKNVPTRGGNSDVVLTEYQALQDLAMTICAYCVWVKEAQKQPVSKNKYKKSTARSIPALVPSPVAQTLPAVPVIARNRTPGAKIGRSLIGGKNCDGYQADGSTEELTELVSSKEFHHVTSAELVENQASSPNSPARLSLVPRTISVLTETDDDGEWHLVVPTDFEK